MATETYVRKRFSPAVRELIDQANEVIERYAADGYVLTLRQLYYQMVAADLIENTLRSYKNLGSAVNDGRLAGLIDWTRLEDRTRNLEALATWDGPNEIVSACAEQFRLDVWSTQPYRVEVWIEKEALANVFERICQELRVPYLACRGYTSQSEMWRAAKRLRAWRRQGQDVKILHFGDHDPSGIDMSADIQKRMEVFNVSGLEFERLALNMDQVRAHRPPPNPAKTTDSRFKEYRAAYGDESWELDALQPAALADLVRDGVNALVDRGEMDARLGEERECRRKLRAVSDSWERLTKKL